MSDEEKKIIVDDDWKAEARREKEQLAQEEARGRHQQLPEASFAELVNIIVVQAMAALGMIVGPGGQRVPPDVNAAKHFIDLLQVLEDKTKDNLTTEEKTLLDQVLYEMRMAFVQIASGGQPAPGGPPPTSAPPAAGQK